MEDFDALGRAIAEYLPRQPPLPDAIAARLVASRYAALTARKNPTKNRGEWLKHPAIRFASGFALASLVWFSVGVRMAGQPAAPGALQKAEITEVADCSALDYGSLDAEGDRMLIKFRETEKSFENDVNRPAHDAL
ncbi:hypothetical protein F6X40_11060 [Paraburkholderia sp. UCT31]|uniref:hypothetical protein n=1 Tax=Paraburkholderia sp. UCT31 TaxID=2615209 RepID=UPI0016562CAF|nr:hypothetical protein [Paraburkholderia sp. UCT31]MBC8737342.1 hypothetical protein [Paraburkholderia sp. UCT31]